jgi:hypothetical protein
VLRAIGRLGHSSLQVSSRFFKSSSSPVRCSTFSSLDPLSYIGRAIFDRDAVRLAAGEKCHHVLADQRHVPQIQDQLLTRCLQGELLLEFLDIFCLNSAAERENDPAVA